MKKGLRRLANASLAGALSWRWCPNEEGIKTFVRERIAPIDGVGGGALMKKGLRQSMCPNPIRTMRWRWCPNEEGIKTFPPHSIQNLSLLEVVP